jgi:pimeloyl-ACP methyl ester carboxylesterase
MKLAKIQRAKKLPCKPLLAALVILFCGNGISVAAELQATFDSIGPTVRQIQTKNGRAIHFIDDGNEGGIPVVFSGGLGTSARVIRLLDFLESMRQNLNLRFITVERNGFGQTEFDESLTMADYVNDVEQVLAHLEIEKFALFGISGGGPYTAKIAEANADRLLSIHMAATSPAIGNPKRCTNGNSSSPYTEMLRYPMQFFGFPDDSPLHKIEGFQDTAFDEAARAHNLRGQAADATPLLHELSLYCSEDVMDSTDIIAPVYVYLGLQDQVLASVEPEAWLAAYPRAEVRLRLYPDGGHDVQYRHLDQILLDLSGPGDNILVCESGEEIMLAPDAIVGRDPATVGLCAWQN